MEKIPIDTNIDRETLNQLAIKEFAPECWEDKMRKMSKPALIRYINRQIESENTMNIIARVARGEK